MNTQHVMRPSGMFDDLSHHLGVRVRDPLLYDTTVIVRHNLQKLDTVLKVPIRNQFSEPCVRRIPH